MHLCNIKNRLFCRNKINSLPVTVNIISWEHFRVIIHLISHNEVENVLNKEAMANVLWVIISECCSYA